MEWKLRNIHPINICVFTDFVLTLFIKCGKNKIKQNLYNKGIEKSIIETAIDDIDTDKEFENALYLGKKRYERLKNEDPRKAYQKIGNHLAYKGFNYDIIKKVLNKLFNDVDEYSC